MEIEQIKEPKEIATILALKDPDLKGNILDGFECTKAEWVQFLILGSEFLDGNQLRIYGIKENGKVTNYMVVVNNVVPPIFKNFTILYFNFSNLGLKEKYKYSFEALDIVKKWAIENGCKKILISTKGEDNIKLFSSKEIGFKIKESTNMELEF